VASPCIRRLGTDIWREDLPLARSPRAGRGGEGGWRGGMTPWSALFPAGRGGEGFQVAALTSLLRRRRCCPCHGGFPLMSAPTPMVVASSVQSGSLQRLFLEELLSSD
jgi:hypothetical protein